MKTITPPAKEVREELRGNMLYAVVLEISDRPLLYGFFPAKNELSAVRTAMMLAEICEKVEIQEVQVWPTKVMGCCQLYRTYHACSRFASNLESSYEAVQLDPAKALVE